MFTSVTMRCGMRTFRSVRLLKPSCGICVRPRSLSHSLSSLFSNRNSSRTRNKFGLGELESSLYSTGTFDDSLSARVCWKCNRQNGNLDQLFFCECGVIQQVPSSVNYFEIFRIEPPTFNINLVELSKMYLDFQRNLHPDRFAAKKQEEIDLAVDQSALVNNAYNTLQKPLSRGLYLLQLRGNPLDETSQIADPEFLMEIMDINEKIAGGIQEEEAKRLWTENCAQLDSLCQELSEAFLRDDLVLAKSTLTRMKYYTNIDEKLKEYQLEHGLMFNA